METLDLLKALARLGLIIAGVYISIKVKDNNRKLRR